MISEGVPKFRHYEERNGLGHVLGALVRGGKLLTDERQ